MLYRRFGRTEINMPVFSCGGMRYQQSWEDIPLSEVSNDNQANLENCIRTSIEKGINHIETARFYGCSEAQLGQVLPDIDRDSYILQTKVPPAENPDEFEAMLETSFEKLDCDYLDLFGFHGINLPHHLEWITRRGGCYDVIEKWRKQGLIKNVGFSTHGSTELITEAIETDLFDYVNLHWYFFFQRNYSCIEAAAERDMGVFIISPSDKGGKLYEPPEKLVNLCDGWHPMKFNDLFCLQDSRVHTLSIGAARPTDFDIHIDALKDIDHTEKIQAIAERILDELDRYHGSDWMKSWAEGLPVFEDQMEHINYYEILRLYNLASGLDMLEYGKMRYNLLGKKDHWFSGDIAGNLEAHDLNRELAGSPFADRIPDVLKKAHELMYNPA